MDENKVHERFIHPNKNGTLIIVYTDIVEYYFSDDKQVYLEDFTKISEEKATEWMS